MSNINQLAISDARATLPDIVEKVSSYFDRVIITVSGKPKAVVLSIEELESLEETAKLLSIPNLKKDLNKSQQEIKKGDFVPLADLK